jgi:DNA-binding transcriptional LysR family regulator
MRVEQIRGFVCVYETGSFTAAARQLYTEQPVITKHVSQLESELGCRLFTRTTRKVVPTHAGDVFYEKVREALQLIDRGVADVKMLVSKTHSELRVGYDYLYMDSVTTSWLKEYESLCEEGGGLSVSESPRTELMGKLTNGDMDCAFLGVTDNKCIPAYFDKQLIMTMGEVIVLGKRHHLAAQEFITINDLLNEDFVYPIQRPTPECSVAMKDFVDLDKQMHVASTQFESSALAIVEMGRAVINLPALSPINSPNVLTIPYRSTNAISYYLVWNRGNANDALQKFITFVTTKATGHESASPTTA